MATVSEFKILTSLFLLLLLLFFFFNFEKTKGEENILNLGTSG